uniref:Putative inactive leucine-rich repeat receptor-like serine threonine-protein kinase n=1 Tax=Lupinus angustifolius TaxID=3871 RepID=A0A182BFD6_LUPAN|nr:putative inactive leucine-rich repeat receptor-like serine threonine-protein kinase [Lupinus angustifolius]
MEKPSIFCVFVITFMLCVLSETAISEDDSEALLALKSSIDVENTLPWQKGSDVCAWLGVKDCFNGRVRKLVLEYSNLTGTLDSKILNRLDQLRVLSFKGNSLSGQIPNLSGLINLKSLFLNNNNFSGEFPASVTDLHRVKVIVLSGNRISGEIPASLLKLRRLYVLYLQDNFFTGTIPGFNQTGLRYLNVSDNQLSGEIPVTPTLLRFNESSFYGNPRLCGEEIQRACKSSSSIVSPPSTSPSYPMRPEGHKSKTTWSRKKLIKNEGVGKLVFLGAGDREMRYSLEDLLKASAETLGRGIMGSTYKAVMESGFIVTVKRLKDATYPGLEEFKREIEIIGRLRHTNLVPLRAYFQAKEERLLVYDYFPNGSLFSLIHGSKTTGGGKPLHWTSCLKIAEDLATGMLYIHQTNPGLTHGNLKSSNVLLGSDFESCLTDYGITMFLNPDSMDEPSATSLFYRAPECRSFQRPHTQPADVYSFGVLLLELLTGKTPFQDLVQAHGSDIPRWVRSVREEETESGDDPASGNEASEEKLQALLNIAMTCVSLVPENRPTMREVLKMIRDARGEAHVSSNSSDHSPGRWSDTVQSIPREEHLSI